MNQKKYKVYQHIVNTNEGEKYYIGQTSLNLEKRFQNGMGYKTQLCFFHDIVLYGWNNIEYNLLRGGLTKEESIIIEKEYIKIYNSDNILYGYNVLSESHPSGYLNEKSKEIICIETGEKYGSIRECARKLGLANSSSITTHIKKRKGVVKGYHYCHSSNILTIEDFEEQKINGKRVMCNETKDVFETMSDCSKKMGINMSYISNSCNNKIHKNWKYTFSFV